ncbi:MAG: DUF3443 family protein [Candidatus Sulfotelmatobacter sp.]
MILARCRRESATMTCVRTGGVRRVSILIPLAGLVFLSACNWGRTNMLLQPPISITLLASATTVSFGEPTTVTASVYDESNLGVVWTVSPLNLGILSNPTWSSTTGTATVTYTAPASFTYATNVTITATSITDPAVASSVTVKLSPIAVVLTGGGFSTPVAPQTVNQGGTITLGSTVVNDQSNLGVTWSLSPASGEGSVSVSSQPPFNATYTAPTTVSAPTTVTLTATSVKYPTASANTQITVLPSGAGPNVTIISVNGGPVPGQVYVNGAFTSITICNPGSSATCQTVNGILVDTGSYGLRILQSAIPLLKLPTTTDSLGDTLENCASWQDGSFLWGPVSTADVYIGGEAVSQLVGGFPLGLPLPVQVISSAPNTVPDGCSNGGTDDNTPQLLGANAILGVGPEPNDCTLSGVNYCDGSNQSTPPNVYYACPSTGCSAADSPVLVGTTLQVSNPIPSFSPDNNGVIIQLPPVSDPQASVVGTMTFGIGTESNNTLGSATIYTLDANDHFTTIVNGQTLTSSFIDSGSNALLFPDSLPACAVHIAFYCPTSSTSLSATTDGATQGAGTVDFTVDNADNLFSENGDDAVFIGLAGPAGTYDSCSQGNASCVFDWGLPFFYGRIVYAAIDGQTVTGAPLGPWWAY